MPCYHPLPALYTGKLTKTGKKELKVVSRDCVMSAEDDLAFAQGRTLWLPCGQCIGCRLERSRQWANRCMLELEYHKSAYFVTLTYNDDHVPFSYYSDDETGEAFKALSLRKRDFQLFMKRLRKCFDDQSIRFYACGEYGPETLRPHYHAILFGLKLDDLVPWSKSPQGFQYYLSPIMQELWSDRKAPSRLGRANVLTADPEYLRSLKGHILVAEVSWETCAYVARYCTKKLTGEHSDYYATYGIEPPFSLMSNRPGIAHQWYVDHPDCYDYEYISVSTPTGGLKFKPPRYFDKLYDIDEPEKLAEIKASRKKMAEAARSAKLHLSYYTDDELERIEAQMCEKRIQSLKRSL